MVTAANPARWKDSTVRQRWRRRGQIRVAVADDRDVARRTAHVRARVDDVGEGGEADVGVAEATGGDAVPGHERAFEGAGARDELGAEERRSTRTSPRTRAWRATDEGAPRAKAEPQPRRVGRRRGRDDARDAPGERPGRRRAR